MNSVAVTKQEKDDEEGSLEEIIDRYSDEEEEAEVQD